MITLSKTERLLAFKKWVEFLPGGLVSKGPDDIWMAAIDWAEQELHRKHLIYDKIIPPFSPPGAPRDRRK